MKKYVSASFMLEMVLVDSDGLSDPVFDLRDRTGQLAVRGDLDDLKVFFDDAVSRYRTSAEKSNDTQS